MHRDEEKHRWICFSIDEVLINPLNVKTLIHTMLATLAKKK